MKRKTLFIWMRVFALSLMTTGLLLTAIGLDRMLREGSASVECTVVDVQ